ncbi:MAG: response regulator [Croceibacterium sp.]
MNMMTEIDVAPIRPPEIGRGRLKAVRIASLAIIAPLSAAIALAAIHQLTLAIALVLFASALLAGIPAYRSGKALNRHLDSSLLAAEAAATELVSAAHGTERNFGLEPGEKSLEHKFDRLRRTLNALTRGARNLTHERERSRELAAKHDQAKVQFFAAMSHELRTPLNAILGYATLLLEDADVQDESVAFGDLQKIHLAGRRLMTLIDDLLELSGLAEGRVERDRVIFSFDEALRQVVAHTLAERGASASGIQIVDEGENVVVINDRQKVGRCVRTLIEAALDQSKGGTVRLSWKQNHPAGLIELTVHDDGPAIAPEECERIFEGPSKDLHAASGRASIGLTLVRNIARNIGGDCFARADVSSGAEIVLTVSINGEDGAHHALIDDTVEGKMTAAEALAMASDIEESDTVSSARLGEDFPAPRQRSVLIIDDDRAALELLERWMLRCGYTVLKATNGETGLELARAHEPDLILLDALMPGRTGYDVLDEMRSDEALSDTPVLLITVDDDRLRGLGAGASDFIRKPVSESQLRAVVSTYGSEAKGDILVIDDDDVAADLMCRNLKRLGFEPRRAIDGGEGMKMALASRPSAILLDLHMPRFDGFAFLEMLAREKQLSSVPVVVVSAQQLSRGQHNTLVASGCHYFSKGSSAPREIVETLKALVA